MGNPYNSPDERENEMIALAVQLAERQLREGTASSQVITHYLKLATSRERLEREILEAQSKLISAKTDSINSAKRSDERYQEAIDAFRKYSGHDEEDDA